MVGSGYGTTSFHLQVSASLAAILLGGRTAVNFFRWASLHDLLEDFSLRIGAGEIGTEFQAGLERELPVFVCVSRCPGIGNEQSPSGYQRRVQ
jgi:hypothetical protein